LFALQSDEQRQAEVSHLPQVCRQRKLPFLHRKITIWFECVPQRRLLSRLQL